MSFPVYLPLGGGLRLHPHLVFEALAYGVGFQLYLSRRRARGDVLDAQTRLTIVAAAVLGAAAGSRLVAWFEDPVALAAHWRDWHVLLAGKTVVGALVGGLVAVESTKQVLGITQHTGDLFAVPIAVGIAIGRLGCFLTGLGDQTYGVPSSLPWAVDFGDGVPRHPVQIYEAVFMVLLAWRLARLEQGPHRQGDVFRWLMIAYMAWRVGVDALKPEARIIFGLSSLQLLALATLAYYAYDALREWSARRENIAHVVD